MDFGFTEDQKKFRQEVRSFLEEELNQGSFTPSCNAYMKSFSPEFSRKLARRGWIGLAWPKEYGGQGRSYIDRLILTEELLRYGAPVACHWASDRQIGRAIIAYGNDEQKKELLPKILAGEAYIGLGMSEPEAGSDLAAVKTKAVEDGDYFVIDGQKLWTSGGRFMNYLYLVARTDPEARKHRGISEFIFEINLPGITLSSTMDITGSEAWNEVFFDGVRIHRKCMLGEKNRAWYQLAAQLDYERSGMERLMANYTLFEAIIRFAKETEANGKALSQNTLVRSRLAQLQVEFEVGRLHVYRVALIMDEGHAPNWEAAMAKVHCTSFEQHLAKTAMEILGLYGQLKGESHWTPIRGIAPESYLESPGYSLQGGTSEILRNIIALRKLELPRG